MFQLEGAFGHGAEKTSLRFSSKQRKLGFLIKTEKIRVSVEETKGSIGEGENSYLRNGTRRRELQIGKQNEEKSETKNQESRMEKRRVFTIKLGPS